MEDKYLAYHDDLTGILNRRAFRETLGNILADPIKSKKTFYLALTDLDGFKKINDTYGHLSGDFIIKEFCKILSENLIGENNTVARYGGDEFVMIMEQTNRETVKNTWDIIRESFAKKEFVLPEHNKTISLSMSIGIAEYPTDGANASDIFSKADEALYSSKCLGKNRTSFAKDILEQVKVEKKTQDLLLKPPLIGREKEFSELKNLLFGQNNYKLVLIKGGMGVGKTRLLEEIIEFVKSKDKQPFLMTCTEAKRLKPYGALIELLGNICKKNYPICKAIFDNLPAKQQLILSSIKEVKKIFSLTQQISQWDAETRINLFTGLADLFSGIIEQIKPILFLDDAEWIDKASKDILSYIVVTKKHIPLSLCVNNTVMGSESEIKNLTFLQELIKEISEYEIIPQIELKPLPESSIKTLVTSIFENAEIPTDFINTLCKVTKGNVFFARELLNDFVKRKLITLKYPSWVFLATEKDFAKNLNELLIQKANSMDTEEKELLMAAAGIGRSFKFDFLTKLRRINHGYLQDIIGRVAEQNIISGGESDTEDMVSFSNEITRMLLYSNIEDTTKEQLHKNIAETIKQENKDDIELVSSEIAFHFDKAKLKIEAQEYTNRAEHYVKSLFSDSEINKIIEEAVKERFEKDKYTPIKDEAWPLIVDIIGIFNSAVTSKQLYQVNNVITDEAIGRLEIALANLFKIQDNLTLINPQGEQETAYTLLVNGYKLPFSSATEKILTKHLIEMMRKFNIGSITFNKKITKPEINAFIGILGQPREYAEKKDIWKDVLMHKKITSIMIDEVIYKRVLSEEEEQEYRKDIVKEVIAKETVEKDPYTANTKGSENTTVPILDKKIKGVTSEEKNILAKTIAQLPHNIIVKTLANEYTQRKKNILDIKDMVLVILNNAIEKQQLLQLLETEFTNMGMAKECFQWLIDQEPFLKHPIKKRINIYIQTTAKTILEMGVLENFKPTLEELFSLQEDRIAGEIINKYLLNLSTTVREAKIYVLETLEEIIKILPKRVVSSYGVKLKTLITANLTTEADAYTYDLLLKTTRLIINKLTELEDCSSLFDILIILKENITRPDINEEIALGCKNTIKELNIIVGLIKILKKSVLDKEKNSKLFDILKILGDKNTASLLNLVIERFSDHLAFESYQQTLQIIELLKIFQEKTLQEIEVFLQNADSNKLLLVLDILEHFSGNGLIPIYKRYLLNDDPTLHQKVFKLAIKINSVEVIEFIASRFSEEKIDTQKFIVKTMGSIANDSKFLLFLDGIKETRPGAKIKKEIEEAVEKITVRIKKA